jgi:hypothetical protein
MREMCGQRRRNRIATYTLRIRPANRNKGDYDAVMYDMVCS